MEIVSRHTANKNFTIDKNNRCKFDGGKYNNSMIGKEIPKKFEKNVLVVWSERRVDEHGPYYALFCISV